MIKKTEFVIPEQATLRDQFAMAALQGLLADPSGFGISVPATCELAYDYADAMLEAREVKRDD